MGMPRVDFDAMCAEIEKDDPKSITEYGIVINKKTIAIMQKHGYPQKRAEKEEAIKYNAELLNDFKDFLKGRKDSERVHSNIAWYSGCNEMSGHTLKFDDMDEEHFNYILFNRAIRKFIGRGVKDYLEAMNSLAIFGEFLKGRHSENAKVFIKIASQKEKMKKLLGEYEKLNKLSYQEKISEEKYCEKMEKLFGYGYLE